MAKEKNITAKFGKETITIKEAEDLSGETALKVLNENNQTIFYASTRTGTLKRGKDGSYSAKINRQRAKELSGKKFILYSIGNKKKSLEGKING